MPLPSFFLFQKIGELNEANMALKERIELLQMEKVRLHMKDSQMVLGKKLEGLVASASFVVLSVGKRWSA